MFDEMSDFFGLAKIWFGTLAYQACDGGDYGGSYSPALKMVVAAKYGDLVNLKKLYNPQHRNYSHPSDGLTPLMAASQQGHLDVVEYLVKRNVAVDMQDGTGETALTKAVRAGKLDVVKYLLKEGKANAKVRNYQGETALSIAVFYHLVGIVKALLYENSEGWNVRECNPKQGEESPMSLARELKFQEIEETLMEYDKQLQSPQALDEKKEGESGRDSAAGSI